MNIRQQFLPFIRTCAEEAKKAKLNRYGDSQSLNSTKYCQARESARAFQLAQAIARGRVRNQVENNPNTEYNHGVARMLELVQLSLVQATGVAVAHENISDWFCNPDKNLPGNYTFVTQE